MPRGARRHVCDHLLAIRAEVAVAARPRGLARLVMSSPRRLPALVPRGDRPIWATRKEQTQSVPDSHRPSVGELLDLPHPFGWTTPRPLRLGSMNQAAH